MAQMPMMNSYAETDGPDPTFPSAKPGDKDAAAMRAEHQRAMAEQLNSGTVAPRGYAMPCDCTDYS